MPEAPLIAAPVLAPFLGAALAMLLRERPRASLCVALATIAVLVTSTLLLLSRVLPGTGPVPTEVFGDWPIGFGIAFSASLPGVLLVAVTTLVATAVMIYSIGDIGPRRRKAGFDALMLAMVGAVNGAFLTNDLFNLYVWFELALLAALGLLTLDRRIAQIDGAIRYAAFAMMAATFILLGIGLVYGTAGTLDMPSIRTILSSAEPSYSLAIAAGLLLGGLGLKSGLAPFHLWLPASYHTAPTSVVATFAGLLTKMAFYGLLFVLVGMLGLSAGARGAAHIVGILPWVAGVTMILCAMGALAQTDMRRILSYHVIAQVGYMAVGLALAIDRGIAAAVFYMVHSIIVQTNLFLGAGLIRRASGSWDLTRTGGMLRNNPLFAFLFAVPVLSLSGIPPFSGFWAKFIVLRESLAAGHTWMMAAGILAGLMTIVSMALFWADACWKDARGRTRPIPASGLAAMSLLSGATVAIGLAPQPLWELAELSARALSGNQP